MNTQAIKNIITGIIVRLILKVLSGVLITIGLEQSDIINAITAITGGLVTLIIGIVLSWMKSKKIALADPSEFYK